MDKKATLQLYEKLYFHEIDAREKLNSRLQTLLTLIVAFASVLAYLLQNYEHQGFRLPTIAFLCWYVMAVVALLVGIYYFTKTLHGTNYSFMPAAKDIEDYRQKLIARYESTQDPEQLASADFSQFIQDCYTTCSSINTRCNDARAAFLHKTNRALIFTAMLAFIAFLAFFFGNLDKSNIKKTKDVFITNPMK